jgi:glycosyltransferase involved in cell wall biosynthesis
MNKKIYLSLIIPSFNEETKIVKDLLKAYHFLNSQSFVSEILIINDGSTDNTVQLVKQSITKLNKNKVKIKVLGYKTNKGKGFAIRYGVKHASGELISFVDAGLCVPYKFLLTGIKCIQNGNDVAIASRRHPKSKIKRLQPLHRRLGSIIFWYVVRFGMRINLTDTQCGFKIYTNKAAKKIFSKTKTNRFMIDIDSLVVANAYKFKVVEFPIEWYNDSDSHYHPIYGTIHNIKELSNINIRLLNNYLRKLGE